jgi:hypothetical protein
MGTFLPSWPGLTRPSRARTPAVAQARLVGRLTGGHDIGGKGSEHLKRDTRGGRLPSVMAGLDPAIQGPDAGRRASPPGWPPHGRP